MKLRLASLREGLSTLEETVRADELGLDEEVFAWPVEVTGAVHSDERMLDIRIHLSTKYRCLCDRCAVDFERTFEVDTRVLAVRREAQDFHEEESEGLIYIGDRAEEIDLSQELLDALVLNQPMQVLCRPDCKGLCHRCGADWNEGPCEHGPDDVE